MLMEAASLPLRYPGFDVPCDICLGEKIAKRVGDDCGGLGEARASGTVKVNSFKRSIGVDAAFFVAENTSERG